jgi:YVTN family beta-propeller protein
MLKIEESKVMSCRWLVGTLILAASLVSLSGATRERVLQTNAAGDNVHVIDPATNRVVGTINDIEVPHGVVISPDGGRIYVTQEPTNTLDVVDAKTLVVTKRIPLSGRPNNVAVTNDGRQVYVGIAQSPGAVDVIDTSSLTNIKSIPVQGAVHNVYVTPDGKYAVSGSVVTSVITVIDTATNEVAWTVKLSSGIRPMAFLKNDDGSTKAIIAQLSNFHGFVVVDFATREEVKRVTLPDVPGREKVTEGIQGSPSHGLAITQDGKVLWATSKWYDFVAAYSIPDFKLLKIVEVGSHPEWLTIPPDGKDLYVAVAGNDATVVVDNKAMKVVARIPVGYVPKRNTSGMLQTN